MESGPQSVAVNKSSANTDQLIQLYGFDASGQINIFTVDDPKIGLQQLGFETSFCLFIQDILSANLLYGISQSLGIVPGLTPKSDRLIESAIRTNLSEPLQAHHETVTEHLFDAWNRVAQHRGALKHHHLAGEQESSTEIPHQLAQFIYYEVFVKDIFEITLKVWKHHKPEAFMRFYLDFADLFHQPLLAEPFNFNEFDNLTLLLSSLRSDIQTTTFDEAISRAINESVFANRVRQRETHLLLCKRELSEAVQELTRAPADATAEEVARLKEQIEVKSKRLADSSNTFGDSIIRKNTGTQYSPEVFAEKKRHHPLGRHWDYLEGYASYIQDNCMTHIKGYASIQISVLEDIKGCKEAGLDVDNYCNHCKKLMDIDHASPGEATSSAAASSSALSAASQATPLKQRFCSKVQTTANQFVLSVLGLRARYPEEDGEVSKELKILFDPFINPGPQYRIFSFIFRQKSEQFRLSSDDEVRLFRDALAFSCRELIIKRAVACPMELRCLESRPSQLLDDCLQLVSLENKELLTLMNTAHLLKAEILLAIHQSTQTGPLKQVSLELLNKINSALNIAITALRFGYGSPISSAFPPLMPAVPSTSHEHANDELQPRGLGGVLASGFAPSLILSSSGLMAGGAFMQQSLVMRREPYLKALRAIRGDWMPCALGDESERSVISAFKDMSLEDKPLDKKPEAKAKSSWWPF